MATIKKKKVLVVEDHDPDWELIQDSLGELFSLSRVTSLKEVPDDLSLFDAVLLDLSLPDSSGGNTLHEVLKKKGCSPVIVVTGTQPYQFGIDSLRRGDEFHDFFVKDDLHKLHDLAYVTDKAISRSHGKREEYRDLAIA